MHCSNRVESTNVKCDHKGCKVVQLKEGDIEILTIPVRLRSTAAAAAAASVKFCVEDMRGNMCYNITSSESNMLEHVLCLTWWFPCRCERSRES